MTYSKKAKTTASTTNESTSSRKVDWDAYNKHILEVINQATENGEETNQVCFISGIVETGQQFPQDKFNEYVWEDDERQNNLLKKDFGCYVEGGKFFVPKRTADTVVFFVDFPGILINYGKFFAEDGQDDFKPYRALLAGEWDRIAVCTALHPDPQQGYGGKSRINRLAKATGVCKQNNPPADFDIGELLLKPFTMDIIATENKGFLNVNISNPASKNKAIPVPEHNIEPFGIMFDGGNDPETLKMISRKKTIISRLEMATNWETSGLKKELDALSSEHKPVVKEDAAPKAAKKATVQPKPAPASAEEPTDVDDFDSDIPF